MLTSIRNPKIQHIRGLQSRTRNRRQAREYVIEGVRLVEDALEAGRAPRFIIYTEDLMERGVAILDRFSALGVESASVSPDVMAAASDTETPQGLLAVMPVDPLPLPATPTFLLLLDRLRDPGNMGTILRTAAAAGMDGALIPPGMGAHFRLPIHPLPWDEIRARATGLTAYLADAAGGQTHTEVDFRAPHLLIIGGEAQGAGPRALQLDPVPVKISMPGGTESLNAAVAAGILMFEAVRQRNG